MLLGPLVADPDRDAVAAHCARPTEREPDDFSDAHGAVLVIGFGRFGQIVSQCLLAEGHRRHHHRQRPRNDPAGRALRLPGLLRRRHSARRAARRRRRRSPARRRLRRQSREREPHRRSCPCRISRHAALRALLRPPSHPAAARQGRRLRGARNLRVGAGVRAARRSKRSASIPTAPRRSESSCAAAISIVLRCSRPKASRPAPTCCAPAWCRSR